MPPLDSDPPDSVPVPVSSLPLLVLPLLVLPLLPVLASVSPLLPLLVPGSPVLLLLVPGSPVLPLLDSVPAPLLDSGGPLVPVLGPRATLLVPVPESRSPVVASMPSTGPVGHPLPASTTIHDEHHHALRTMFTSHTRAELGRAVNTGSSRRARTRGPFRG